MENTKLFYMMKSAMEHDRSAIVICDLEHTIVYMNSAAKKKYEKSGGEKLIGKSLINCHNDNSNQIINKVIAWFKADKANNMIYTYKNEKENKDVYMVALRDESDELVGYYEKHEYRSPETAEKYDFKKSLI